MESFIETELFAIGDWVLTTQKLFYFVLVSIVGLILSKMIKARWKQRLYQPNEISPASRKIFEKYLKYTVFLILAYGYIKALGLDFIFYPTDLNDAENIEEGTIVLRISHFVVALLILTGARITDWVLNNIIVHKYYSSRDRSNPQSQKQVINNEDSESIATRIVQMVVLILSTILILKNFNLDFELFTYTYEDKSISFKFTKILVASLILVLARLIVWLTTQILLYGIYKRRDIETGAQYAINQLFKYVIYTIAFLIALHSLGINMTLIWGGAAALLVGIGLGLQQTFNDFFSGLVLLFERSVSVGDILDIDGKVGTVQKIGLRASILETRSFESIIVPNSKLVNDHVMNWTHFTDKVRFDVQVGVAYGSDTDKVKKLLLKAVTDHPLVLEYPTPFVRFNNFGDSALEFSVFFFTKNYIIVEDIRSDIRFKIDKLFREHDIAIPFPQRDIWIRSAHTKESDLDEEN